MESHDVRAMAQDVCCVVFQTVNVIGHAYENCQRRGSKTKLYEDRSLDGGDVAP